MSSLAKSAVWVTFSEIVFNLSGFIIHIALGRILGPEEYGKYGLVVTLTTMIIILIGNGIPTAMAKYISEYFETKPGMVLKIKRQALILQTALIGSVTAIFFFLAPVIAGLLNDPSLSELFQISTLIIPAFAAASFYFSYFTGLHKFNLQAALKIFRSLIRIGIVIGMAYFLGVKGSILGYVIAPTLVFLAALILDKFIVDREIKKRALEFTQDNEIFPWKKLVNYAWQIIIFFLAYELLINIDLYLVKALLRDDRLTGIYNAALTVGRIPHYIFYAMTIFLLPMISKSTAQNNHFETKKILSRILRIILVLVTPMVILLSIFSTDVLKFLYGNNYAEGALAMSVLVFGVGFMTIFYVLSFAMNGSGKTKISIWTAVAGVLLNTFLNYILIQKYGLVGSAIATSIASFTVMIIMLYFLYKKFDVIYEFLSVFRVGLAGLMIYIISAFTEIPEKLFIPEAIILFAVYIFLLFIFKEMQKENLTLLKNMFLKKIIKSPNQNQT